MENAEENCELFADRNFKMAAMTRLSLTLDPMGISHFHLSSLADFCSAVSEKKI
jgi:hypothetical protein